MKRVGSLCSVLSVLLACSAASPEGSPAGKKEAAEAPPLTATSPEGSPAGKKEAAEVPPLTATCDAKAISAAVAAIENSSDKGLATAVGLTLACPDALPQPYLEFFERVGKSPGEPGLLTETDSNRAIWEEKACPGRSVVLRDVANTSSALEGEMLFQRCGLDAAGVVSDGGELSPSGTLMPWAVHARLMDQGVDAKSAKTIAAGLIELERATFGLLPLRAGQSLPTATRAESLHGASPQIFLGGGGLWLGGKLLIELEKPESAFSEFQARSHLIGELYPHLEQRAAASRGAAGTELPMLVIAADPRTLAMNVFDVAMTAAQSRFLNYGLAVQLPNGRHGVLPIGAGTKHESGKLQLRLHISGDGYYYGSGTIEGIPRAPDILVRDPRSGYENLERWDAAALREKLVEFKQDFPGERQITISVDDDVPVTALVQALVVARGPECDPEDEASCLYLTTVLVAGIEDGVFTPTEETPDLGVLQAQRAKREAEEAASESSFDDLGLIGMDRKRSGFGRSFGEGIGSVPLEVRQETATVVGGLDKDIIRRIVRAHINEVRSCYAKGLSKDPKLAGKVVIDFVISSRGRVSESTVTDTDLTDSDVANCMATTIKRWKFPKPSDGGEVAVKYPFTLSPA